MDTFSDNLERWRSFSECDAPHQREVPVENCSKMQRLCVMRALRPEKMVSAIFDYVLGKEIRVCVLLNGLKLYVLCALTR